MGNGEKLSQKKPWIKRRVHQLPKKPLVMDLTRPTLMENGKHLRKQGKNKKKKKQGEYLFTIRIFIMLFAGTEAFVPLNSGRISTTVIGNVAQIQLFSQLLF